MARPIRAPGRRMWFAGCGLAAAVVVAAVAIVATRSDPEGDPGRLDETFHPRPPDVPLPRLVDATSDWGLDSLRLEAASNPLAGGAALGDLDRDGDLDLVVANGELVVLLRNGSGYDARRPSDILDAAAVSLRDVDADGWLDVLVATEGPDAILWGGNWLDDRSEPQTTVLDADGRSAGLLAADLTGDGAVDIVRLGRGGSEGVPDILWVAEPDPAGRAFIAEELPHPERLSLAGELVDADGDGLLDVWIGRDVGWAAGPDSVLSRKGDPTGELVDVGGELGADLNVDAMGITVADLDGDGELDAYVSDLGDNEMLIAGDGGFRVTFDTGAARIRPPGAPPSVVSSSWASGVVDLNLDGVLDLVVVGGGFPDGSVPNKIDGTEVALGEPPAVMLGLGDGRFVDVWPDLGLDVEAIGRGLAIGDMDGDGDEDLLIVDRRGTVRALRNDTTGRTVSIVPGSTCPTSGMEVVVEAGERRVTALLAAHTYAGAHASGLALGVGSERVTVMARWRTAGSSELGAVEIAAGDERAVVGLECG